MAISRIWAPNAHDRHSLDSCLRGYTKGNVYRNNIGLIYMMIYDIGMFMGTISAKTGKVLVKHFAVRGGNDLPTMSHILSKCHSHREMPEK